MRMRLILEQADVDQYVLVVGGDDVVIWMDEDDKKKFEGALAKVTSSGADG